MRAFKDYFQKSMEDIEVDSALKTRLARHLFSKPKKPFWTWPKMFFTAPVVAIIAIALILNSGQPAIRLLSPQEALAQALDNTFNFDTFEKTFGLPDDGNFYHRILTYQNNYNEGIGPYIETMNLWTDSKKIRADFLLSPKRSKFREFRSFLVDPALDFKCELVLFMECASITQLKKEYAETFVNGLDVHYPVSEENLINDLSVHVDYENPKGPAYNIKWSTLKPLNGPALLWSNDPAAGGAVVALSNDNNYANKLENGKYWYFFSVSMDPRIDDGPLYFQIETEHYLDDLEKDLLVDRKKRLHSMIYAIDKSHQVKPVSPKDFLLLLQDKYLFWGATDDSFKANLRSFLFFLKDDSLSGQPLLQSQINKNEDMAIQIRYKLPTGVNFLFDSKNVDGNNYYLDIFLNPDQTRFMGYSLIKNDAEIESLWVEDTILPDVQKEMIFDKTYWQKSIAEKEKHKKPEQEEWFKTSKQ